MTFARSHSPLSGRCAFGDILFIIILRSLRVALLALGLAGALSGGVRADETNSNCINWAYMSNLGDGVLVGSPEKGEIYKLPFSFTAKNIIDSGWDLRFKIPLTVGVYNLHTPEENINVDVMSVVPGVELEIPITENWSLIPLASFGTGKDSSGGSTRYLYSLGIKHYLLMGGERVDVTYGNALRWDGYSTRGEGRGDAFTSVDAGLDVRFPLGFNLLRNPAHLSLYGIYRHFFGQQDVVYTERMRFRVNGQLELGVTLGTIPRLKIWRLPIERMGIGYRSGDRISTLRVFLGMPF